MSHFFRAWSFFDTTALKLSFQLSWTLFESWKEIYSSKLHKKTLHWNTKLEPPPSTSPQTSPQPFIYIFAVPQTAQLLLIFVSICLPPTRTHNLLHFKHFSSAFFPRRFFLVNGHLASLEMSQMLLSLRKASSDFKIVIVGRCLVSCRMLPHCFVFCPNSERDFLSEPDEKKKSNIFYPSMWRKM